MIEAEYTVELDIPVERVWEYVEVIPNWAPFIIGYQKVNLVDDRRSVWTLRGDVGILSREVDLQVDITLWEPLSRAEFTITGLTERMSGQGSFSLSRLDGQPAPAGSAPPAAPVPVKPRKEGPLRRLRFAFARFVLRRLNRKSAAPRPAAPEVPPTAAPSSTGAVEGRSRLAFKLEIAPGGPMAPMIELLMTPMVEPAAEDFLGKMQAALVSGARP